MMDCETRQLTDEQLCSLCRGTAGASEELVQRYTGMIRRYARPYYLAGAEWEDLQQEGFLGLLSAIENYRPEREASFKTFASSCIRTKLISSIRASQARNQQILNEAMSFESSHVSIPETQLRADQLEPSPEQTLMEQEALDELLRVLATSLSTLEQQTLDLFLLGLSYREIAERLGKSTKSVDNAVQRIRTKLARNRNLA